MLGRIDVLGPAYTNCTSMQPPSASTKVSTLQKCTAPPSSRNLQGDFQSMSFGERAEHSDPGQSSTQRLLFAGAPAPAPFSNSSSSTPAPNSSSTPAPKPLSPFAAAQKQSQEYHRCVTYGGTRPYPLFAFAVPSLTPQVTPGRRRLDKQETHAFTTRSSKKCSGYRRTHKAAWNS